MGTLSIKRSGNYFSMARAFKVFANGKEIGRVKNAKTEVFELDPGIYKIKSGVSAISGMSPEIPVTIVEGQTTYLNVKIHPFMILFLIVSAIGGATMGGGFVVGNMVIGILGLFICISAIILSSKFAIKIILLD